VLGFSTVNQPTPPDVSGDRPDKKRRWRVADPHSTEIDLAHRKPAADTPSPCERAIPCPYQQHREAAPC
jgi:hypothetical protein